MASLRLLFWTLESLPGHPRNSSYYRRGTIPYSELVMGGLPLRIQNMVRSPFGNLPKDVRNNRLRDRRIFVSITKWSLRAACRLSDVRYATTLHFVWWKGVSAGPSSLPRTSRRKTNCRCGPGSRSQWNASLPLVLEGLDAVIYSTPSIRPWNEISFSQLPPERRYLKSFMDRNPSISIERRCNLEKDQAIAMSPHNSVEHFTRLLQTYGEFQITSGAQILNLIESRFSTQNCLPYSHKAAMQIYRRSISTELKLFSNAAHVTITPDASADGTLWTLIAILPEKQAK